MAVDRIGSALMGNTSMISAANPSKAVKNDSSFGSVLTKASSDNDKSEMKMTTGKDGQEQKFNEKLSDAKNAVKDEKTGEISEKQQIKTSESSKGSERIGDAVDKAVEEVKDIIKEELGITDEELETAMANLGLTSMDLLDTGNITALVAEVTGSDIPAILTDENLSSNVMNITSGIVKVTSDLIEELDVSVETFKDMQESGELEIMEIPEEDTLPDLNEGRKFEDYLKPEEIKVTVTSPEEMEVEGKEGYEETEENDIKAKYQVKISDMTERASDETDKTAGTKTETVSISIEPDRADRQPTAGGDKSENSTLEKFDTGIQKPVEETVKDKGTEGQQGKQNFGQNEAQPKGQQINLLFQDNLTNAVREAVDGTNAGQVSETAYQMSTAERVENILNQIKEEINISVDRENASMELQLNPASLGKVGLHIETKAGTVTAQFVAETAQVKEALESQITDLKETLINKGIRIEEVEVTIASHAFEQNFMNNGGSRSGNFNDDSEGAARSARLRRINLTADPGEAEEVMSEEEELARRIMIDNGNSVDYTA